MTKCDGGVRYGSPDTARSVADRRKGRYRVYACKDCRAWHLKPLGCDTHAAIQASVEAFHDGMPLVIAAMKHVNRTWYRGFANRT